jgi:hypothetical protein
MDPMVGKRTRYTAKLKAKAAEADVEDLHAKIGQLLVELDRIAKAPNRTTAANDQARSTAAVGRAPVRVGGDQPLGILLPAPRVRRRCTTLMRLIDAQFLRRRGTGLNRRRAIQ